MPKAVDEYLSLVEKFPKQDLKDQIMNPVWHVHNGSPPKEKNSHVFFNVIKFSFIRAMLTAKK